MITVSTTILWLSCVISPLVIVRGTLLYKSFFYTRMIVTKPFPHFEENRETPTPTPLVTPACLFFFFKKNEK